MAEKPVEKPVTRPGRNGGRLNSGGVVGVKGRSGRKPNWLKDFCDDLLADPKSRKVIERAMHGEEIPPTTVAMWKAVAERAHGKPKETVEHQGQVSFVAEVPPKETEDTWAARGRALAARGPNGNGNGNGNGSR